MFRNLKIVAAALALLAVGSVAGIDTQAQAQTSCYQVGNYTYCNGPSGQTTSCYRVGNYTYCN